MKTNILVGARFHSVALADVLTNIGEECAIYTSARPGKFKSHKTHFVPMVASVLESVTHWSGLRKFELDECVLFDRLAKKRMREADVLYGWAGYSLLSGKAFKARGKKFLLERSCPHVDFQEAIVAREAERLKIPYLGKPSWWIERVKEEYQTADKIILPSNYSLNSFLKQGFSPEKLVLAPLDYASHPTKTLKEKDPKTFVVGCLGGNVLRKGFLYLFEAWERLNLKNAKLLLRTSEEDLRKSPVLSRYLDTQQNIEVIPPVPHISDFYSQCDVFCLPSVDDGFGLVVTEALSHGLPVLATNHVGAMELLKGVEPAFLVKEANSDALAEKLQLLYSERAYLKELRALALSFSTKHLGGKSKYHLAIAQLYKELEKSTLPKAA